MKYMDVFASMREVWQAGDSTKVQRVFDMIESSSGFMSEPSKIDVVERLKKLSSKLKRRWNECNRTMDVFLKKHATWLDTEFELRPEEDVNNNNTSVGGRLRGSFEDLTERSKRRRTATLRSNYGTEELIHAAASSLRSAGKRGSADVMTEVFGGSPTRPKKVKEAWEVEKTGANAVKPLSPEQALNYIVEAKLTKQQYLLTRSISEENNAHGLFPNYHQIRAAKKDCYPPEDCVKLSESSAEMQLQALMDQTASRLISFLHKGGDTLDSLSSEQLTDLVLISKWGSDGSSGYSMFKQKADNSKLDDRSLYVTSVVPLQLYCKGDGARKIIVWQNPRPSSARYCRPIKLEFVKETTTQIVNEYERLQKEISSLTPSTPTSSGLKFSVKHEMHMTMGDGKVFNALTDTKSSQSCYICGARPSQMNCIDTVVDLPINMEALMMGIAPLHALMPSFEYLLHISYKISLKKYKMQNQEERNILDSRTQEIRKKFREEMGLIIDMPKPGFGSSNDGNTARTFFANTTATASITGLDEDLLKRFSYILTVVSGICEINVQQYQKFAMETAEKCVDLYSWYVMPPTVHKLLIHGASIIQAAPLPIGMLSESAQESKHKDYKYIRVFNTRKISRKECMTDMLHMGLISSDPLITGLRKLPTKSCEILPQGVLRLLQEPCLTLECPSEDEDFAQV